MNMNISTIEDIISLLMRRDDISENEARNMIDCCRAEIHDLLSGEGMGYGAYDEVCEIMADYLSLEPDFIIPLLLE